MEAEYDSYEIVCVIGSFKLVDSESYERRYWRRDRQALPLGYYVVHWPVSVLTRRFNEEAVFFGCFRRRDDALAALARFQASAPVTEPAPAKEAVTEHEVVIEAELRKAA